MDENHAEEDDLVSHLRSKQGMYTCIGKDASHEGRDERVSPVRSPQPAIRTTHFSLRRARRFVNRSDELALVERQLEQLRHVGSVHECVLNISGVPGIGKSALLGEIADRGRANTGLRVFELDMALLYPGRLGRPEAPPAEAHWPAPGTSPRLHLLRQLADWSSLPPHDLRDTFLERVERLGSESGDEELDHALAALANLLIAHEERLLLIIDSWDVLPDVLPPWIERVLLLPLVKSECGYTIVGSQTVARWWQFEIRRHAQVRSLKALDRLASAQQIGLPSEEAQQLYTLTYGYPLANEYFYEHDSVVTFSQIVQNDQPGLMRGILAKMEGRVLEQISEELGRVMRVMTLFREFDVNTLRAILPQFYPEFAVRSQSSLMMSLKELLATRLVSWNEELRAYEFEPTIRRIYAHTMLVTDSALYEAVHISALSYYEKLIRDDYENSTFYLVEYCYHTLYKPAKDFYNKINIDTIKPSVLSIFKDVYASHNGHSLAADGLHATLSRLEQDDEIQDALALLEAPPNWFEQLANELHHSSAGG